MPRSGSYSASLLHPQATTTAAGNVGPAGGGFGPEPSASPTGFGRNGINERSVSAGGAGGLPPISTALPGFLPTNRGRAVSDTEAFTRSALTSSPTTSTTAPAGLGQSQQGVTPYTHAPPPLQQHPNHHHPSSLYQDQREYFGSSAATSTTTGNVTTNTAVARSRMGASDPLHPSLSTTITVATAGISSNNATTTTNSRQADNFTGQGSPLPDEAASAGGSHTPAWQRRSSIGTSRSSMDYPPSSSSSSVPVQEYEPHPFSSASLSARRSQGTPSHHFISQTLFFFSSPLHLPPFYCVM
ncbi:hypothetical protein CPB86DRAFT_494752 [Serendipita vermifera]|nr:hypothetical protein CPB86DRAFT_494752 [Serendipita vermifera]